ncbi:MAG: hypothetical protein HWE23_07420 [Rhodobacteraceae bacterium]|nr:hypothetical protein [Paracoccaceae bacterium]
MSPTDLVQAPLWPDRFPTDMRRRWDDMRKAMRKDSAQGWQVWIDWYERVLKGGPIVEELEFDCRLSLIEDPVWKEGTTAINSEIQRREEDYSKRQQNSAGQSISDKDVPPLAGQTPALYHYQYNGELFDVVTVDPQLSVSEDFRDGFVEVLKQALMEFQEALAVPGCNAYLPVRLQKKLQELVDLLDQKNADTSEFAAFLRSLSVSIERQLIAIQKEGGCGSGDVDETLLDIRDSMSDLKGCYREIAIIERETLKTEIRGDNADEVIAELKGLSDKMSAVESALSPKAKKSLHGALDWAEEETDPELRADIAVDQTLANRNLAQAVKHEMRRQSKEFAKDVISEGRKAAAKWLLRQTASVVTLGLSKLLKYAPSLKDLVKDLNEAIYAEESGMDDAEDPDDPDDDEPVDI